MKGRLPRSDLATIRRMNRLARMVFGARGIPPSDDPAVVQRATASMRRLAPAYTGAIRRLGR